MIWKLIRKLLLYIEEQKGQFHSEDIKINGFDSDTINYHLKILFENNLITAIEIATNNRILYFYIITGMTWTGHELIDTIRNDNVWE